MKTSRIGMVLLLCGMLTLISGCTLISLNPFYTGDQLVMDDRIVGSWHIKDDSQKENHKPELWSFTTNEQSRSYTLVIDKDGKTSRFDVHLFKCKGQLLMDLYPDLETPDERDSSISRIHLLPVHTVSTVGIEKDALTFTALNEEWFRNQIIHKKANIAYVVSKENMILLTAETGEIRAYLEQYAEEAFKDGVTFELVRTK